MPEEIVAEIEPSENPTTITVPEENRTTITSVPPVLENDAKMWYLSVELWTSMIALACFGAQIGGYIEIPIPGEIQASFVSALMIFLRAFKTKGPIAFTQRQLDRLKGVA
jgi:hypothetical protein